MQKRKITKEDFVKGAKKVGVTLAAGAVLTGAVATGIGVKNQRAEKQAAEKAKKEAAEKESYRKEFREAFDLVFKSDSIEYAEALNMAEREAAAYKGHVDVLK
ncbi:MAG: hypothetical protein K6B71_03905, partial [Alphaproteobacteria bacterium]|nr:hypothetical protein [Alphaproteobacteria bacterium]